MNVVFAFYSWQAEFGYVVEETGPLEDVSFLVGKVLFVALVIHDPCQHYQSVLSHISLILLT